MDSVSDQTAAPVPPPQGRAGGYIDDADMPPRPAAPAPTVAGASAQPAPGPNPAAQRPPGAPVPSQGQNSPNVAPPAAPPAPAAGPSPASTPAPVPSPETSPAAKSEGAPSPSAPLDVDEDVKFLATLVSEDQVVRRRSVTTLLRALSARRRG